MEQIVASSEVSEHMILTGTQLQKKSTPDIVTTGMHPLPVAALHSAIFNPIFNLETSSLNSETSANTFSSCGDVSVCVPDVAGSRSLMDRDEGVQALPRDTSIHNSSRLASSNIWIQERNHPHALACSLFQQLSCGCYTGFAGAV